jgi:hypothetical protein
MLFEDTAASDGRAADGDFRLGAVYFRSFSEKKSRTTAVRDFPDAE